MKKCSKCKVEKQLEEFHKDKNRKDGLMSACKSCNLSYRTKNKKRINSYSKNWYLQNKERHLENNSKWYKANKESKMKYQKHYKKQLYHNQIEYRILTTIKSRINKAINNYKINNTDSTLDKLGCSIKEYFVYLESKFDNNMSWDNYGDYWEIDHIQPLSKGGSFHYTNTQPLTVTENRTKGNRV